MSSISAQPTEAFHVEIDALRLCATLYIKTGSAVTIDAVLATIKELKLVNVDETALREFLKPPVPDGVKLVIAHGSPPIDERSPRVEFQVPVVEHSAVLQKVDAGQILATLDPAAPGTDGTDVFGQPIPHKKAVLPLTLGRNIALNKKELTVSARGNLHLRAANVWVEPLTEMRSEDLPVGRPVRVDGDLFIKGPLHEGCMIEAAGSVIVAGAIEPVQLRAAVSICAKGGIVGRNKTLISASEDLECRFITNAHIFVGQNLQVLGEIVQSKLNIAGFLLAARGPICGGEVSASGGITCPVLGAAAGTPTLIEAGGNRPLRLLLAGTRAEIDANRKRIAEIREKIAPLMQHQKSLTTQQKERATELLFEADALERRTDRMTARLEEQFEELRKKTAARVTVAEIIHTGVTLRFRYAQTITQTPLVGPLIITEHKGLGLPELIAHNPVTHKNYPLRCQPIK